MHNVLFIVIIVKPLLKYFKLLLPLLIYLFIYLYYHILMTSYLLNKNKLFRK